MVTITGNHPEIGREREEGGKGSKTHLKEKERKEREKRKIHPQGLVI